METAFQMKAGLLVGIVPTGDMFWTAPGLMILDTVNDFGLLHAPARVAFAAFIFQEQVPEARAVAGITLQSVAPFAQPAVVDLYHC